jgi:hypothetical protein
MSSAATQTTTIFVTFSEYFRMFAMSAQAVGLESSKASTCFYTLAIRVHGAVDCFLGWRLLFDVQTMKAIQVGQWFHL